MGNLIELVKTFQDSFNQQKVEKIMNMFTEDATFEIVGLSKFAGKQNVKNIFEYGSNKFRQNNMRCAFWSFNLFRISQW